jgi:hypothetical protein
VRKKPQRTTQKNPKNGLEQTINYKNLGTKEAFCAKLLGGQSNLPRMLENTRRPSAPELSRGMGAGNLKPPVGILSRYFPKIDIRRYVLSRRGSRPPGVGKPGWTGVGVLATFQIECKM